MIRLRDVARKSKILMCAPTNVGTANLYERCLAEGYGDECALVLAPERIPPGTAVQSNDPSRRIVCATISSRAGPFLDSLDFDAVFVDEAAQCVEALLWTLLRPEVTTLVMAGDVKQLPGQTSESGRALGHERSLMERLIKDFSYDNVTTLSVQNRMAPELLRFPNAHYYDDSLVTGAHAPRQGSVEVHILPDAREESQGTSVRNKAEAEFISTLMETLPEDAIILCPYLAQCRLLLSHKTGQVHTIDSSRTGNGRGRPQHRGDGRAGSGTALVVALPRAPTRRRRGDVSADRRRACATSARDGERT